MIYEWNSEHRIIPLDGRPHGTVPTLHGRLARPLGGRHARRRDHQLHAEAQLPRLAGDAAGVSMTPAFKLTERFTRTAEDTIVHTYTVDDPTTWTRPWTVEMPMHRIKGPMLEYRVQREQRGRVHDAAKRARPGGRQAPAARPRQERRRSQERRSSSAKRQEVKFAAAVAIGVLALAVSASVSLRAQQARTVKDGVYTAAQAKRGEADFRDAVRRSATAKCSKARPVHHWPVTCSSGRATSSRCPICSTRSARRCRQIRLGRSSRRRSADVIAFILQANKFPPGRGAGGRGRGAETDHAGRRSTRLRGSRRRHRARRFL